MAGIPGPHGAPGLKALRAARLSMDLERVMIMALDGEYVLGEYGYPLVFKGGDCRHHCVRVLLPISQYEPSCLQGGGTARFRV